jgi:hypothetical protein
MPTSSSPADLFPQDYRDARSRFLQAARAAGGTLEELRNPAQAPDGNPTFTDLSWHGPADAERVLVLISGTHGVEGFPGTAAQLAWLEAGRRPERVAVLLVHALNPHGYAWIRRVTEGNVDLNRNFVDHDRPYPGNPGYEELFPALCPRTWDAETVARCDAEIDGFAERHGAHALQRAISGGQYRHADGIFFGGHAPTWSRRTLEQIVDNALARARSVAVVDVHTGLGPYAHGERIVLHDPNGANYAHAKEAWAGDVANPVLGDSVATELSGTSLAAIERRLPDRAVVATALEFGTVPTPEVRRALRADNWLHMHAPEGTLESETGQAIKAELQRVFAPAADDWRGPVIERTLETVDQAADWLCQR